MNTSAIFTTKNIVIAAAALTVTGLAAYFLRDKISFGSKKDDTSTVTVTPAADVVVESASANDTVNNEG